MASSSLPARPHFPVPQNMPAELELEGALDVYEPARVLFSRVLKFMGRAAYEWLESKEIRMFLRPQIPLLVSHTSVFHYPK